MAQLQSPIIATSISLGWSDKLVLSVEDTEKLIKLLNKATIYRCSYSEKASTPTWNSSTDSGEAPRVAHSIITEEDLAEAKMNQLIDP